MHRLRWVTSALLFTTIVLWIANAEAASFDCTKAQTPDEVAVCEHRDLSALDSEMGGLWFAYDSFPFLMGMSGQRQDEAQAFLQERGRCGGDVACLRQAYEARIAALKKGIESAMQTYCRQ